MATAEIPRRWAWPALAGVLAGGLALRLWGIKQGLPYVYNIDEASHFVPRAVAMFGHDLNPHYFANPPAFTYLLHFLFAIAYGGKTGVRQTVALHPADAYTLARVAAALLGTVALWLLYATGARLFGRAVGLLAAAIEAVAFLPVFYAHLALNDAPTLAPATLSLLGTAGILRKGRRRDYLLAGAGLGLACASKYTAGIVLAPLVAAVAARYLGESVDAGRRAAGAIALTAGAALGAFLLADPYAVLDYARFHSALIHQSTISSEAQGKLGAPTHGGLAYYLWSLTWGLGWVPALAALGGALTIWFTGPRPTRPGLAAPRGEGGQRRPVVTGVVLGWLLVPGLIVFLAFMGLQGRYFGRWLLPIFPILCLLAAFFVVGLPGALADLCGRASAARRAGGSPRESASGGGGARRRARRRAIVLGLGAALVAGLLAQGLFYSVHSGLVLSRSDTRGLARAWMVSHIPAGAPIVLEPVVLEAWARERRPGTSIATNPYRWPHYPTTVSKISAAGAFEPDSVRIVGIEEYERTLAPVLIGYYERNGYCWVVSGSTQSGRAFAAPRAVPLAIAYYRALESQGEVVYRGSPYARGRGPVAFNFDWSFDYYPLAYHRPGPAMTVYRLRGGRCRR
jgi:dolichyl-phosphate-mannose-protein mannosyltransferase